MDIELYIKTAISAALKAGAEILRIYERDFSVTEKADASPLTEADEKSDLIIRACLRDTFPIISEECKNLPFAERQKWTTCWLVDPLDGTKEFIKRNGEFTVNIALIENGIPILGVVYLPVIKQLFFGAKNVESRQIDHVDEFKNVTEMIQHGKILTENKLPEIFTIVASRSHLSDDTKALIEKYENEYQTVNMVSKGSSIKICMVAQREAHVYPRLAPTMEWDTGAGHAVAKYAGCTVLNYHTGEELKYNKENLLNPHFIVSSPWTT